MTYKVEFSRRAERNIRKAYQYIAEHGPADPADWKAGLTERLALLETFPKACPLAPENAHVNESIRQLVYGSFRVLFTFHRKTVYVLTVRHTARRPLSRGEMKA